MYCLLSTEKSCLILAFYDILGRLEASQEQKFSQMFSRCPTSCPFSAVNNLRLVYFIFRLKDLPEYSNHGNISSKFKNCNYTMT